MSVRVYNKATNRWVKVESDKHGPAVKFVDNQINGTVFSLQTLIFARDFFEEFASGKGNLLAVPVGTNTSPEYCFTVGYYITLKQEERQDKFEGDYIDDQREEDTRY